jgi:hypothetical protein
VFSLGGRLSESAPILKNGYALQKLMLQATSRRYKTTNIKIERQRKDIEEKT